MYAGGLTEVKALEVTKRVSCLPTAIGYAARAQAHTEVHKQGISS